MTLQCYTWKTASFKCLNVVSAVLIDIHFSLKKTVKSHYLKLQFMSLYCLCLSPLRIAAFSIVSSKKNEPMIPSAQEPHLTRQVCGCNDISEISLGLSSSQRQNFIYLIIHPL